MHPQFCLASDQARATLWSFSSYPHDWAPVGCVAPPPGCSNSPWVRASAMQRKYAAPICLHSPGAAPACSVLKRNCERNMCQLSGLSKYKVRSLSNIYNVWKQQKRGVAVARVSVRMVLDEVSPGIAGRVRERLSLPASMALAPGMAAYSNTHTDRALQSAYRGSRSVRFG